MKTLLLFFISLISAAHICACNIGGDTIKGHVVSVTYTHIDPDIELVKTAVITFKTSKGVVIGQTRTSDDGSFRFIMPDSIYREGDIRISVRAEKEEHIRGPRPKTFYSYRYRNQNIRYTNKELNLPLVICLKRIEHREKRE